MSSLIFSDSLRPQKPGWSACRQLCMDVPTERRAATADPLNSWSIPTVRNRGLWTSSGEGRRLSKRVTVRLDLVVVFNFLPMLLLVRGQTAACCVSRLSLYWSFKVCSSVYPRTKCSFGFIFSLKTNYAVQQKMNTNIPQLQSLPKEE